MVSPPVIRGVPGSTASPSSAAAAVAVAAGETSVELDSVEGIEAFKYAVTVVILVITVVAALFPLWVSQNGNSRSKEMLSKKLPFLTAGVFIGSGLMHLLPDAVKMYNKALLSSPDMFSEKWMQDFPMMYLLSALGCMIVWAVDLINLGDSPKMMAVASAARPNHKTSMYRMQVPRVASFSVRRCSNSLDAQAQDAVHNHSLSFGDVLAPVTSTRQDETTGLLSPRGMAWYSESTMRTYSLDCHTHHRQRPHGDDQTICGKGLVPVNDDDIVTEETVSEHVVFSGESPLLPYLLAALFSVHSLIAGFALGVNRTSNKTAIATAVAIFSHKVIEAMSVGANFARAKESIAQERSIAVLTLYSCMTPVGIVLGMLLSSALQGTAVLVTESVALSIASGSFVYLAFHEMSDEHGPQDTTATEKILLFGSGLFSMAALATWA